MLLQRAIVVSAMVTAILPPAMARAAEAAGPPPIIENGVAATPPAPIDPPEGIHFDTHPARAYYALDTRDFTPQADSYRFDFERLPAPTIDIRLEPALSAIRTGWAISGRAGPMRWTTPLGGENSTVVSPGGRDPVQPGAPGPGTFYLSVTYVFE
ncbi:MAG TPA: hypothetical protein VF104_01750 [Burkholderiales bacterium]